MEEPGRLQSMGLQRVGHDWVTSLSLFTFMHWRKKWQPTPVFLPGESQGWWAAIYGIAQSRTWLKRFSSSSSSSSASSLNCSPLAKWLQTCHTPSLGECKISFCQNSLPFVRLEVRLPGSCWVPAGCDQGIITFLSLSFFTCKVCKCRGSRG